MAGGPQCYNCRRRRLPCDSAAPHCKRCETDRLDCLGYVVPFKSLPFRVSPKSKHDNSLVITDDKAPVVQERLPNQNLIHSIMQTLAPFDREYFAMLEAFRAFNGVVLPRLFPPQRPFRRPSVPGDMVTLVWLVWPKALQYLVIVDLRFMESSFTPAADPLSRPELCRYRGLGITELRKMIPQAVSDPHGTALCGIIIIMAADMQLSSRGSWVQHYAAAQRIMWLRGGAVECMHSLPSCHTIFVSYMLVDIMSATTTKATDLSLPLFEMQREYPAIIPDLADDILEFGTFCPIPILQNIISINLLRAHKHVAKARKKLSSSTDTAAPLQTFDQVQFAIEKFDAGAWAEEVLSCGEAFPLRATDVPSDSDVHALAALGLCYKSATMVYLHLSCRSFRGRGLHTTLDAARALLSRQAHALFDAASVNVDGPLPSQLWKYIGWPLVILAHASVLAPRQVPSIAATDEVNLLRAVAGELGSKKLYEAADAVASIWAQRALDKERQWRWDDAFPTKRSFAV